MSVIDDLAVTLRGHAAITIVWMGDGCQVCVNEIEHEEAAEVLYSAADKIIEGIPVKTWMAN